MEGQASDGRPWCKLITTKEAVTLPAEHEIIVHCRVEDDQNLYWENHLHLLQNDDITLDPHTEENYVVARALVGVRKGIVPEEF